MMVKWSDEQILAYLDGVLDLEEGRALYLDRQNDPQLDAYITSMEADTGAIGDTGRELLADPPQFAFERKGGGGVPAKANWIRYGAMAASLAVVFGAGYLTSKFVSGENRSPSKWVQAVAEYQTLYTGETLELVEKTDDQRAREVARIGRKIDLVLARTDLEVDGLQFKRSQLLTFKNQQLVQFAFVDKAGIPIAFCIIKRATKIDKPPADKRLVAGMNATVWAKGNYGFVVIGKAPGSEIKQYANVLQKKMLSL